MKSITILLLVVLSIFQVCAFDSASASSELPDFLVNDDIVGGCEHSGAAVAKAPSGDIIIAWTDNRTYSNHIYARRFGPDGIPIGDEFQVDVDGDPYLDPLIATDCSGRSIIAWIDTRDVDTGSVYCQRYDSAGNPIGDNMLLNGIGLTTIAMSCNGNFVVSWSPYNSPISILAQRFDFEGNPIGALINVREMAPMSGASPAVAMDDTGRFVISWTDFREYIDYGSDVYAQRFDSSGAPLGGNFRVNDDLTDSSQIHPAVAMQVDGSFLITWSDFRNGADVYAQVYDSDGSSYNDNFKVNDNADDSLQGYPKVCVQGEGCYIVTWRDERNGIPEVFGQRLYWFGYAIGGNMRVCNEIPTASQSHAFADADSTGEFVVAWVRSPEVDCNEGFDRIFFQRFDSAAVRLGDNTDVNRQGDAYQTDPSIAVSSSGTSVLVWMDYRDMRTDRYAQRFDASGDPLGSNFKVNDENRHPYDNGTSAVDMNDAGKFIVAWTDTTDDSYYIYAQRYDQDGNPVGGNFRINEDYPDQRQEEPTVAMTSSGGFVFAWQERRVVPTDIYAQVFDSTGTPLYYSFVVNDEAFDAYHPSPAVAVSTTGDFIVAWTQDSCIVARRFDATGNPIDASFHVFCDQNLSYSGAEANVAISETGSFVIAFDVGSICYIRRYDSSGMPIGSEFIAPIDYSRMAMTQSGTFVVAGVVYENEQYDVYAQEYSADGTPGDYYMISDPAFESSYQSNPAIAVNEIGTYFAWEDDRRAMGLDIYARIADQAICGDCDGNGSIDIDDIVYLVNYIFTGGPEPSPLWIADTDCSGDSDIDDVIYLVGYVFLGGPMPCDPNNDGIPDC